MKEIWKVVPYANKYKVSNFGRLVGVTGKILRTRKNACGYFVINIHTSPEGKLKTYSVHKIVMESFRGERKAGYTINHIDGNKENNRLENLEYVSHLENMRHAFKMGLVPKDNFLGTRNPKCKLSEKDVIRIRRLYSTGRYKQSDLSKIFSVDQTQISCIVLRKSWRHI